MMWVYTVTESDELQARRINSMKEIQSISKGAGWLWIDFMDPDDRESGIIAELLKEIKVVKDIKEKRLFSQAERVKEFMLLSIPHVVFKERLKRFPVYVLIKTGTLITIRSKHSSRLVRNSMKTFEDCVGKVCEEPINSSFILSRFFHEISNENLDAVMALRESIDKIEQKALANPGDRRISHSVFAVKREASSLERIFWSQRELILSMREGVVPMIETSEEIKTSLVHPINNISRELTLLESHNNALDSILRLQDLGMIHRVERNLIYLTLIALFVSVLLILLEVDILSFMLR